MEMQSRLWSVKKGESLTRYVLLIGAIIVSFFIFFTLRKATLHQAAFTNEEILAKTVYKIREAIERAETNPSDASYNITFGMFEPYTFTIQDNTIALYFPRKGYNITDYFFISNLNTIPQEFQSTGIIQVIVMDRNLLVTDELVCNLTDPICDAGCIAYKLCDPACYLPYYQDICSSYCLDTNQDHYVSSEDADLICDPDCYNTRKDGGYYDIDCIFSDDGICDPDTHLLFDGLCDTDCKGANGVCDPDCLDADDPDCPDCGKYAIPPKGNCTVIGGMLYG